MSRKKSIGSNITRRRVLAGTGAVLATPFVSRFAYADRRLRVYTWEGYAEPEWVERFERETGAKAQVVYTGSADEMFAKMQGSKGADYDVVAFDTSLFNTYLNNQLIQPIDMSKVPNAANLLPAFREVAAIMRDGKQYGIPWGWGSMPLIYDKSSFPTPPESWDVMWNSDYAQQMTTVDDSQTQISNTALVLGFSDPFNLNDEQLDAVKKKLIEQKSLVLTYYSGFDEGVSVFASSGLKLMLSYGEPQLPAIIAKGVDAGLTIPKEGAIGWLDCWTVSAGATDLDLAHAWINICLDESSGSALTKTAHYGNTTSSEANVESGYTYGDKLVWQRPVEDLNKRVKLWNEIKAS